MVATAHSDPYAIFVRKIGYSGGLENTLERARDLESLYRESGDITASSWQQLVTGQWGLEKSENITNAFYSLRLVRRNAGDVLVLENLDAMAIASSLLNDLEARDEARAFIILWAILVNDGEIFVNVLLASFEEERIKQGLSGMMLQKRAELREILPGKESARRIQRVITIERQQKNKGSAGAGRSISSIKRTSPLATEGLKRASDNESDVIEFSDDYFRKVPPKRRDWARSLGLWSDRGLTARGKVFIEVLKEAGYIDANGYFTYWPMDYELVRAGFRPDLLGARSRSLWHCLIDFGKAYGGISVRRPSAGDVDDAVTLIERMMQTFRSLHARKSMLRREMPITVAFPAAVAYAHGLGEPLLDLPAAIVAEQTGDKRRLTLRRSRNTGGALSTKK